MGLLGFFFGNGKKNDLLGLQRIVMKDSPNRLIMTEAQLMRTAKQQAQNDLRIIKDSASLASKTLRADVFFSRLELLGEHSKHLRLFEPYLSFKGASPATAYRQYVKDRDECIRQFLERYCLSVRKKATGMKTDKGRLNQYQKAYDSLKPYFNQLNIGNRAYVEKMLNQSK